MKDSLVRRIYHIVLTVVLILAGLFLINGCLLVYYSGGEQIYTLKKISAAFRTCAWIVYLALASIVGAIVLDFVLPAPKKRKPEKNHAMILKNLQAKTDLNTCPDPGLRHMVLSLRRQRKLLTVMNFVILGISSVVFLLYAMDPWNYPSLTMGSELITFTMVQNVFAWLICLTPPFIFAVCTAYIIRNGMQAEAELLRHLNLQKTAPKAAERFDLCLLLVRIQVTVAAVALIVIGYLGDGWVDVLTKAAAICTECVGLG